MKRNPMRILLAMLLCWVSLCGLAQEVTYIHERDIMNQFTTMETGAGVLSPAWYYNSLHKKSERCQYKKQACLSNGCHGPYIQGSECSSEGGL